MTGTLGLFSLVDLFQLLSSAQRSGRLGIDHPAGRARVYFDKGQVVHAEFGELSGEEAVFALFGDERGTFEFRVGIPAVDVTITSGTENLVLEAIRRLDEARRDGGPTVARDAVPTPDASFERASELTLTEDESRVLDNVDGDRNVTQIALDAGLDPDAVLPIVERLVRIGVLKMRGRRPRTARLVARLGKDDLAAGVAGLDAGILNSWQHATGTWPDRIACRRQDGTVLVFQAGAVNGAGPYIFFSRDTLFRSDLAVNEALLVRPVLKRD